MLSWGDGAFLGTHFMEENHEIYLGNYRNCGGTRAKMLGGELLLPESRQ